MSYECFIMKACLHQRQQKMGTSRPKAEAIYYSTKPSATSSSRVLILASETSSRREWRRI